MIVVPCQPEIRPPCLPPCLPWLYGVAAATAQQTAAAGQPQPGRRGEAGTGGAIHDRHHFALQTLIPTCGAVIADDRPILPGFGNGEAGVPGPALSRAAAPRPERGARRRRPPPAGAGADRLTPGPEGTCRGSVAVSTRLAEVGRSGYCRANQRALHAPRRHLAEDLPCRHRDPGRRRRARHRGIAPRRRLTAAIVVGVSIVLLAIACIVDVILWKTARLTARARRPENRVAAWTVAETRRRSATSTPPARPKPREPISGPGHTVPPARRSRLPPPASASLSTG